MKELGMVLFGCFCFSLFFVGVVYPDMEYKGYPSTHSCYGECYKNYIAVNGTLTEQMEAKAILAAADEFSSIKGLWAGCAACHGTA